MCHQFNTDEAVRYGLVEAIKGAKLRFVGETDEEEDDQGEGGGNQGGGSDPDDGTLG